MKSITVPGRPVRYWDFDAEVKNDAGDVVAKGNWAAAKETTVTVNVPESVQEALEIANGNEARLLEIIEAGLKAEAEEQKGAIPETAWSAAMVKAADNGFKAMPQFVATKESAQRRPQIMRFIGGNPALRDSLSLAYAQLRNQQDSDAE
jgi:hypothetical protein